MKSKVSLIIMALLYVLAGINHFVHPNFYLGSMPHYLPFPLQLIYISGVIEINLGILLLPQKTRKLSAWLIILMLIVFLSFHIQMIVDAYPNQGWSFWIAVIRLPLQFVLINWAYKLSQSARSRKPKAKS